MSNAAEQRAESQTASQDAVLSYAKQWYHRYFPTGLRAVAET